MARLVLASGSPRRRELLRGLGLELTVRPVDIDESPRPGEAPEDYVERLATEKALARVEEGELVVAADTIVTLDEQLLGKPADAQQARLMLRRLNGREHRVATGVALHDADSRRTTTAVEVTHVRFATMTDEEIAWYVATGEPMDKAGAYAIQGLGALFVDGIQGSYSNVVGLPIAVTYRLFQELDYELREMRDSAAGDAWPSAERLRPPPPAS